MRCKRFHKCIESFPKLGDSTRRYFKGKVRGGSVQITLQRVVSRIIISNQLSGLFNVRQLADCIVVETINQAFS
jgi:hypothetical protein